MTIFDLTEALRRYRRQLAIAFAGLIVFVLALAFTIEDGSPTWRAGPSYESSIQIAVVPRDVESLAVTDVGSGDVGVTAALYAEMLSSAEAATAVGASAGYVLGDPMEVTRSDRAPIITAKVIGPSDEQAKAAALAAFEWLEGRLQEPLVTADLPTTTTTVPVVEIDRPFDSAIEVSVDASFEDLPRELFLLVNTPLNTEFALQVSSLAGSSEEFRAALSPTTTVVLSLQLADGSGQGSVRIAPPTLPRFVSELPVLEVTVGPGGIYLEETDEDSTWLLDPSAITVDYGPGIPIPSGTLDLQQEVDIALLTTEPIAVPIGTRRGPIILIAALLIGVILIFTAVIIVDAWHREKERSAAPVGAGAASQRAGAPARSDDSSPRDPPGRPDPRQERLSEVLIVPPGESSQPRNPQASAPAPGSGGNQPSGRKASGGDRPADSSAQRGSDGGDAVSPKAVRNAPESAQTKDDASSDGERPRNDERNPEGAGPKSGTRRQTGKSGK